MATELQRAPDIEIREDVEEQEPPEMVAHLYPRFFGDPNISVCGVSRRATDPHMLMHLNYGDWALGERRQWDFTADCPDCGAPVCQVCIDKAV